jgi:hypothetical protein
MLQARRSRDRVSMKLIFVFILPNASSRTMAPGSTQYQECSWWVKCGRRVRLTTLPRYLWADCPDKMCEPRRHTILWAFTACFRDSNFRITMTKQYGTAVIVLTHAQNEFVGPRCLHGPRVQTWSCSNKNPLITVRILIRMGLRFQTR